MPDDAWTPERVAECLVEAFRSMQGVAIRAHRGRVEPVAGGRIEGAELLAIVGEAIRDEYRLQLLTWANCRAKGEPLSEVLVHFRGRPGWSRSAFERNREFSLRRVADFINQRRAWERAAAVPPPASSPPRPTSGR